MEHQQGTQAQKLFVDGLRNAHAMEKQALAMIKPQVNRIENYPELVQRMRQHWSETEGQISRLETLLGQLGESPSALKDTVMSVMGGAAVLGHTPAGDEILKDSIANFAFENYEIAAYTSLIALASASGHAEAIAPLEQTLSEEEDMAAFLEQNLAPVTAKFVALRESGAKAKH